MYNASEPEPVALAFLPRCRGAEGGGDKMHHRKQPTIADIKRRGRFLVEHGEPGVQRDAGLMGVNRPHALRGHPEDYRAFADIYFHVRGAQRKKENLR